MWSRAVPNFKICFQNCILLPLIGRFALLIHTAEKRHIILRHQWNMNDSILVARAWMKLLPIDSSAFTVSKQPERFYIEKATNYGTEIERVSRESSLIAVLYLCEKAVEKSALATCTAGDFRYFLVSRIFDVPRIEKHWSYWRALFIFLQSFDLFLFSDDHLDSDYLEADVVRNVGDLSSLSVSNGQSFRTACRYSSKSGNWFRSGIWTNIPPFKIKYYDLYNRRKLIDFTDQCQWTIKFISDPERQMRETVSKKRK